MHTGPEAAGECERCMLAVGTPRHTLLFEIRRFPRAPRSASAEDAPHADANNGRDSDPWKKTVTARQAYYSQFVKLVGAVPSPDEAAAVTALAWVPEAMACTVANRETHSSHWRAHGANVAVNEGSSAAKGLVLAVRISSRSTVLTRVSCPC
jgi:hypothetical protein